VATGSCIFAALLTDSAAAPAVERRAQRLRGFYALEDLTLVRANPHAVVGRLGSRSAPDQGMFVWGEPLPAGLSPIDAPDDELRRVPGVYAAFAWGQERLRIIGSAGGPATLYAATGDGVRAISTHAVAAAVIAGLEPRVDESAVAEFIALDYVGGERTLVAGVEALPAAADIRPDGERSWWPARERWAPVADAYVHTEHALLSTLSERTRDRNIGLALTGGLDSTVGAIALRELDVKPLAFTWGDPDWPDPRGAARTAATLGFEHVVLETSPIIDADCLAVLERAVRWSDGVTALSAVERVWPDGCDAFAGGMGGETGRAFYYDAWSALLIPRPRPDELARRLGARGRLRGAHEEVVAALEQTVRGWVDEALDLGARGWNALDVLYTEQRVRRWGRSQIPPLEQDLVLLFTPTQIARGLASLPVRERIRDGFHRRFLTDRGLPPAPADVPDPGAVSVAARRLQHRLRRRAAPAAPQPDAVDLLMKHVWDERPQTGDWVREDALRDPLISGTLGADWAEATARGFAEGRARTTERALRAAGVVAFDRALAGLR
jgi:hypothetical protein